MKIICIGRNYVEHAKELNNSLPSKPLFFFKPDVAILKDGNPFFYPYFTKDLHYECEVVVKINKVGKHIAEKFASNYYNEITLGIDFTARDLQQECKEKGLPWEQAKSFDYSAPISNTFIKANEMKLNDINFKLLKNNILVQSSSTKDLIFSIDYLISYISQFITLKKGDLIFTGTPAGVGPVIIGDVLTGFIEDKKMFEFEIK
jgi:acylpyruvate hydrolase